MIIDENGDRARDQQREYMRGLGVDPDSLSDEDRAQATAGTSSATRTRSRPTCRPASSTAGWTV